MEFPPGDAELPDPEAAWKALEQFWKELQKHLPARSTRTRRARFRRRRASSRPAARARATVWIGRRSLPSLLETWDCESKIIQYRWADIAGREEAAARPDRSRCTADFARASSTPFLAQWRQYVYRLSVDAADAAREMRGRRAPPSELAELRRPAEPDRPGAARERAGAAGAAAEVSASVRRRVPGHRPGAGRDRVPAGARTERRPSRKRRRRPPDWRTRAAAARARCSSSAIRSSRSTASAAPTSTSTTSCARRFSDPAVGRVLPLTMNFRSVPALCDWANDVFETRFPDGADRPRAAIRGARCRSRAERSCRRASFTLTHTVRQRQRCRERGRRARSPRYIRSEVDAGRRQFSDFLILTRKKRDRIAPYARCARGAEHPDRGERRRRVRRVAGGRGADGAAARARRPAGSAVARRRAARAALRHQRPRAVRVQAGRRLVQHLRTDDGDADAAAAIRVAQRAGRAAPVSTAGRASCPAAPRSTASSSTPATSRLRRRRRAAWRPAICCTPSIACVRSSRKAAASPTPPRRSRTTARRRTRSSRCRSSPGAPTSSGVMNLHKAKGLEADVVFLADPGWRLHAARRRAHRARRR